jgi:predicted enzyme related to lactoylglutathione lyase
MSNPVDYFEIGSPDPEATKAFYSIDNGEIEFAHLIDPLGNRFAVWRPKAE